MEKYIRKDNNLLSDLEAKIENRLVMFGERYLDYLTFLSTLNYQLISGTEYAPNEMGENLLYEIAYDIVVTCLKEECFDICLAGQYKYLTYYVSDDYKPQIIATNSEFGNILLVSLDEYLIENELPYSLQYLLKESLFKYEIKEEINTIIFVPTSKKVPVSLFMDFGINDIINKVGNDFIKIINERYNIYGKYLDLNASDSSINVMCISDFILQVKHIGKKHLESRLYEVKELISNLEKRNIGLLFDKHKTFFIELFKISCNTFSKTNYHIDEKNLTVSFFGKKFQFKDYIINTHNIDNEIVQCANNNISLLDKCNVYQLLMTSEFLMLEYNGIEYFDNTFIVSGYFKTIELLLYKILEEKYNDIKYNFKPDEVIINENLEVGKMNEIIAMLVINGLINKELGLLLFDKIEEWKLARNGYFHKHILCIEECVLIKNLTYELIFYIIGILPERKSSKTILTKPGYWFDVIEQNNKQIRKIRTELVYKKNNQKKY